MATSLPESADGERLSNPSVGKKAKMLQKDFPLLFCLPTAPLGSAQCMCNSKVHSSECQSREICFHFTTKHLGTEGTDALLVPVLPRFSWDSPGAHGTVTPGAAPLQRDSPRTLPALQISRAKADAENGQWKKTDSSLAAVKTSPQTHQSGEWGSVVGDGVVGVFLWQLLWGSRKKDTGS